MASSPLRLKLTRLRLKPVEPVADIPAIITGIAATEERELLCSEFFAALPGYIEHELGGLQSPPETQAIWQHLRQCPECRELHEAILQALHMDDALPPD